MSRLALFVFLLLLAHPGQAQTLADLDWIAGGWTTADDGGEITEEHWTPAAGPKMFGISRSFSLGKPNGFEHIAIESRGDAIFYLAMPDGKQPPVEFRLTECRPGWAVFENPEHDFPKRIIYEQLDKSSLRASVSAGDAVMEWEMTRIR